jgi:hypothetical protein
VHRPAHDPSREGVEDDGEVEPAVADHVLGDVGHPGLVGAGRVDVALHQVIEQRVQTVRAARPPGATPVDTHEAAPAHRPADPLAAETQAVSELQLCLDAGRAVGAEAGRVGRVYRHDPVRFP